MSDKMSIEAVNLRFSARGTFNRWLTQQHGYLPMLELQEDNQEPISLRKIFIPLRLGKADVSETDVSVSKRDPSAAFRRETKKNLLGHDAFDEILNNDFLVISGRPGAGKTTLIKALINELCAGLPSDFRSKAQVKYGKLITLPIILRDLPSLDDIVCFESLMEQWWSLQKKLNKRAFEKDPNTNKRQFSEKLDIQSLKESLEIDELTSLVLFDGIDEVGSVQTRKKIYNLARQAQAKGCKVIITGRPSGLDDLKKEIGENESTTQGDLFDLKPKSDQLTASGLESEKWLYIQPLTKPQIESFIDKWYKLDPTWVSKLGTHPKEFLDALGDPERSHLLPLARRPIFLSLMAIVHCTKNEMPHGRAELYKTIVDVYLTRQRKHRRLKETTLGRPMPQWDSHEPRTALGYIAWQSMQRGEHEGNDDRRILWKKKDLEEELHKALKELKFNEIKPEDTSHLIDYFLDPAGLLVEPIDGQIQFAHLSFQEYMCAEYLQSQIIGRKIDQKWRKQVLENLHKPGWDEVALLLMTVHADRTQNRGHFELISYLDISDMNQADLLLRSLLGKELPIQKHDREQWAYVMIMAALLHPSSRRASELNQWSHLEDLGKSCIAKLIPIKNQEERWEYLVKKLTYNTDFLNDYFDSDQTFFDELYEKAKDLFLLKSQDTSEKVSHSLYALLSLMIRAKWGVDGNRKLISTEEVGNSLNHYLNHKGDELLLWHKKNNQWSPSLLLFCLENLAQQEGYIQKFILSKTPVSTFVLFADQSTHPSITTSVNSRNNQHCRTQLALILDDLSVFLQTANDTDTHLNTSSRMPHIGAIYTDFISSDLFHLMRFSTKQLEIRSGLEQRNRAASALSSLNRNIFLNRSNSQSIKVTLHRVLLILNNFSLSPSAQLITEKLKKHIQNSSPKYTYETHDAHKVINCTTRYILHQITWYKFSERPKLASESESLPLPGSFELFDDSGIPKTLQIRKNWVALKVWLSTDENILNFVFPNGLEEAEHSLLIDDLQDLRKQEWSPFNYLDSCLNNWQEDTLEQDWSYEKREADMVGACERLLESA